MNKHCFTILCHLAASLSPEDQLSFLRVLVATSDADDRHRLAGRALNGERVWEAMHAPSALCHVPLESLDSQHFYTA